MQGMGCCWRNVGIAPCRRQSQNGVVGIIKGVNNVMHCAGVIGRFAVHLHGDGRSAHAGAHRRALL